MSTEVDNILWALAQRLELDCAPTLGGVLMALTNDGFRVEVRPDGIRVNHVAVEIRRGEQIYGGASTHVEGALFLAVRVMLREGYRRA